MRGAAPSTLPNWDTTIYQKCEKMEHVIGSVVVEARRQRDMWGVAGGRNMVPEPLTDEGGQGGDESASRGRRWSYFMARRNLEPETDAPLALCRPGAAAAATPLLPSRKCGLGRRAGCETLGLLGRSQTCFYYLLIIMNRIKRMLSFVLHKEKTTTI